MTRTSGGRTEEYWYSSDLELVRRDVDGRTVLAVSQDGRSHTLTEVSGLKTIRNGADKGRILGIEFCCSTPSPWPDHSA